MADCEKGTIIVAHVHFNSTERINRLLFHGTLVDGIIRLTGSDTMPMRIQVRLCRYSADSVTDRVRPAAQVREPQRQSISATIGW
jgi:hypothetical protein